ncbi:hypothetical protein [Amycolatopsis sp. NPDC051061]|uniref:hypothetical protein n=1 Tax=Amycolatopsis sp. NPDC051061 TaxID=3155042 RepID=UPI0034228275
MTATPYLATVYTGLSPAAADGLACVLCHRGYLTDPQPSRPVGIAADTGSQVFACSGTCHTHATTAQPVTTEGGTR